MGFKEIIQKLRGSNEEGKARFKMAEQDQRIQEILEARKKSANERELERYINEEREKSIKEQLEFMRKKRDEDIKFGHNPLNVKNITSHTDWEVLKERNMFKKQNNIFVGNGNIHKNNPKLLQNNRKMYGI